MDGLVVHRVLSGFKKFTISNGGILSVILSSQLIKKEICALDKKEHFDLIHSCNRNSAVAVFLAAKSLGIPSVLHIRDYWPFCPTSSLQRYLVDAKCGQFSRHCMLCHFEDYKKNYGTIRALAWSFYAYIQTNIRKLLAKNGTRLIAISEFVKRTLVSNGFKPTNIIVVPNPIELNSLKTHKTSQENTKILIFSGRLTIEKGILDLIMAVRRVHSQSRVNFELRLFGDPDEMTADLLSKCHDPFIKQFGKISHKQMLNEFSKGDIVVLPFRRPEPFGRVIVEAMSVGVPVISSSTGGVTELIIHGKTGLLVEPGNITKLSDSIKLLLENEALRVSIGSMAAKSVSDKYENYLIAQKMIHIYESLIKEQLLEKEF
jgi:glycosyltransferase involved in cell wall biosynthesis